MRKSLGRNATFRGTGGHHWFTTVCGWIHKVEKSVIRQLQTPNSAVYFREKKGPESMFAYYSEMNLNNFLSVSVILFAESDKNGIFVYS